MPPFSNIVCLTKNKMTPIIIQGVFSRPHDPSKGCIAALPSSGNGYCPHHVNLTLRGVEKAPLAFILFLRIMPQSPEEQRGRPHGPQPLSPPGMEVAILSKKGARDLEGILAALRDPDPSRKGIIIQPSLIPSLERG